ncbi:MAG TPA: GntR family transcriptional regulator [Bacillota bacterium]
MEGKIKEYKSLSRLVYEQLRNDIYYGVLLPGSKVVVDRLSKEYGVSKIPIREAIQKLAAEGLVEVAPHKGAVVTVYSPRDVEEIYAVRSVLEPFATRLAAEKMSDSELQILEGLYQQMAEATEEKDYRRIPQINHEFHQNLYKFSQNRWLYKILMDLWGRTRRSNAAFTFVKEHAERMFAEHQALMKALRERDAEAAEEAARTHVLSAKRGAIEYAEKWGGSER